MYQQEWEEELQNRILNSIATVPFGISFLDDALCGLSNADLILIGARTGLGKTQCATQLSLNFSKAGKSVAFFALEADQYEIHRRMKYQRLTALVKEHYGDQLKESWPRFREWKVNLQQEEMVRLEKHVQGQLHLDTISLRTIYTNNRYTVEDFIEQAEGIKHETDIFIIDHLHYFDLGNDEFSGLKKCIQLIREFALSSNKAVIVFGHLRKNTTGMKHRIPDLDDFHGHSDIVKIATEVIILGKGDIEGTRNMGSFPTFFHFAKSRTAAENTPYALLTFYDLKKSCYQDSYYVGKSNFGNDPEMITNISEIPKWMKQAKPFPSFGGFTTKDSKYLIKKDWNDREN